MIRQIIALLLCVLSAQGSTINFSSTGNDTTGDGSLATPYATLQKSMDVGKCEDHFISIANGAQTNGDTVIPPKYANCVGRTYIESSRLSDILAHEPDGYRVNPAIDSSYFGKMNFSQGITISSEAHGYGAGVEYVSGGALVCFLTALTGGNTLTAACRNGNVLPIVSGTQVMLEISSTGNALQTNILDGAVAVGQKLYSCGAWPSFMVSTTPGCGTPLSGLTCTPPACQINSDNGVTYIGMPLQVTVGSAVVTSPDAFGSLWTAGRHVQASASGLQLNFTPPGGLTQGGIYTICNPSGQNFSFCDASGTPVVLTSVGTGAFSVRTSDWPRLLTFRGLEMVNTATTFGFIQVTGFGWQIDHNWFHEQLNDTTPPQRAIIDDGTATSVHDNYCAAFLAGEAQCLAGFETEGSSYLNNYMDAFGEDIIHGGNTNFLGTPSQNVYASHNYFVQHPSGKVTYDSAYVLNGETGVDVGSGTTVNLTYAGGQEPAVGQTSLVGCAASGSTATLGVTDNQATGGNTYVSLGSKVVGTLHVEAFGAVVTKSAGAFTVTCTSSVSNKLSVTAVSYQGLSVSLDGAAVNSTGTGTAISTASIVTTHNASIQFLFTAGGSGGTYTAGSFGGIYSQSTNASNVPMAIQANVGVSTSSGNRPHAAGTIAANMTGGGGTWVALGLALQGTAVTPTSTSWYSCYDPNHCGGEWYMDASGHWWQGKPDHTWESSPSPATPNLCNVAGNVLDVCGGPQAKNLTEHKNLRQSIYTGNVYEYSVAGAQQGEAINHSCEGSGAGYSNDHIMFTYNKIAHVYAIGVRVSQCGVLVAAPGYGPAVNHVMKHIVASIDPEACGINNNTIGCAPGAFIPITYAPLAANDIIQNVTQYTPDTGFASPTGPSVLFTDGNTMSCTVFPLNWTSLYFAGNLMAGDFNGNCFPGHTSIQAYWTNSTWTNSILLKGTAGYTACATGCVFANFAYPTTNATIKYVNATGELNGNYHLQPGMGGSPYNATNCAPCSPNGADLGADVDMVNMLTSGAIPGIPNNDVLSHLDVDYGSTSVVFNYDAQNSGACTASLYAASDPGRVTPIVSVADSAGTSIQNGLNRHLLISTVIAASTHYYYSLGGTGCPTPLVGEFTTFGAGTGTTLIPISYGASTPAQYSISASMSSPTILSAAVTQYIPVAHGTPLYVQQGTAGPIRIFHVR